MVIKLSIAAVSILLGSVVLAADLPDSSTLPRVPDVSREKNSGLSKRGNIVSMAIYYGAEEEAEKDLLGTEVVSLEESQRILSERRKKLQEKENSEKGAGE